MRRNKAYTLLELSIVIMIIGLLLAGITAGRTIKENSVITKVFYDLNKYTQAVISFHTTYQQLPGDMSDAYAVFGSACGGGGSAKCNGNGNGFTEGADSINDDEFTKVFHHLHLAGAIEEIFLDANFGNGITDLAGYTCSGSSWDTASQAGLTGPEMSIPGGTIAFSYEGTFHGGHIWFVGKGPRCGLPIFSLFTPVQAKKIDSKLDDAIDDTGYIISADGVAGGGDTNCIASSAYNLSNNKPACFIYYNAFEGLF